MFQKVSYSTFCHWFIYLLIQTFSIVRKEWCSIPFRWRRLIITPTTVGRSAFSSARVFCSLVKGWFNFFLWKVRFIILRRGIDSSTLRLQKVCHPTYKGWLIYSFDRKVYRSTFKGWFLHPSFKMVYHSTYKGWLIYSFVEKVYHLTCKCLLLDPSIRKVYHSMQKSWFFYSFFEKVYYYTSRIPMWWKSPRFGRLIAVNRRFFWFHVLFGFPGKPIKHRYVRDGGIGSIGGIGTGCIGGIGGTGGIGGIGDI